MSLNRIAMVAVIVATAAQLGAQQPATRQAPVLIEGVTVIPMDGEKAATVTRDRSVLVSGGIITEIGAGGEIENVIFPAHTHILDDNGA